ncbi:hypothetical protein OGAPHI_004169 [Ogataea philodendri]|uniref:Large ribosomal subunit protein mL59 domain-containing protein n=1 Tax=Ogataea philodendri TaxID=1378263 RepID=A0A9P8P6K0_9ASCO|nr:uncharacterized protein OGAPHI_004169 [Ogataea philodendri]KAH3665980.1 hypothetical protein OGAPHI_004169 [Ogataea philodendri]
MSKLFSHSAQEAFQKLPLKLRNFFTRYPPAPFREYASEQTVANAPNANPFIANRHPVTGKVQNPIYSLRRQSDLYKLAFKFGVADLMPSLQHNKKFYAEKFDTKPLLKGVLSPKGHKWERTFVERKQKIADAVAKVDEVIAEEKGANYRKRPEKRQKQTSTWV